MAVVVHYAWVSGTGIITMKDFVAVTSIIATLIIGIVIINDR